MTAIDERLSEIISKALQIDEDRLTENISRETYEPWDSMAHLLLISEMENEFEVFFEEEEILNMRTIGDIREILMNKLQPRSEGKSLA